MQITVVNQHHGHLPDADTKYIGRGSPLGNPFSHVPSSKVVTQVDTREEAVAKYREYLSDKISQEDPPVITELTRLYNIAKVRPLKLLCFCAPKACHGDVIKEVLLGAAENDKD